MKIKTWINELLTSPKGLYQVKLPFHNPKGWLNISEEMSYNDAIDYARKHFGADENGYICLIRKSNGMQKDRQEDIHEKIRSDPGA